MSENGSDHGENDPNVTVAQMTNAIADRLVSARQHNIPIFNGAKDECPIKFMRAFERVAKALKWDDSTKMDKFPNYLSGPGEDFHYIFVDSAEEVAKPDCWDALKDEFLNHFMRGDYKSHLSRELGKRKKLESESMIVYITSIQTLCRDLDSKMSNEQIMNYILDGLDQELAAQIQCFNPKNVDELKIQAKCIESANERRKQSSSENSKEKSKKVNAVVIEDKSVKSESKSDDLMTAVNKLTETVNNLNLSKNGNKNARTEQNSNENRNDGFKRSNFRNNNNNRNNNYSNNYNNNRNNNKNYNSNNGNNSANNYNNYRNQRQNNSMNYRNNGNQNMNQNMNRNNNRSNVQCFQCNRFGHIRAECRSPPQNMSGQAVQGNQGLANQNYPNNNQIPENRAQNSNVVLNLKDQTRKVIQINVEIKGRTFSALIDSGADCTLMRKCVAEVLGLELIAYKGHELETCDKTIVNTFGQTSVQMKVLGEKCFTEKIAVIIVERLPADILLGMDSMSKLRINIDCAKQAVSIDNMRINSMLRYVDGQELSSNTIIMGTNGRAINESQIANKSEGTPADRTDFVNNDNESVESKGIPLSKQKTFTDNVCRDYVHSLTDVILEPKVVSVIKLVPNKNKRRESQNILVFTNDFNYNKSRVVLQNSVLRTDSEVMLVSAINMSNTAKQIRKGQILGVYEPIFDSNIKSIDLTEESVNNIIETNYSINSMKTIENYKDRTENQIGYDFIELRDGKVKCGPHLTNEQKIELRQLLLKYPDLLSFDETKVGRIKNYEYHLNVKPNHNPVRQGPPRTSFENMAIVDSEVDRLLNKGIIKPSKSPYSSRTVLVRRKDGRPQAMH